MIDAESGVSSLNNVEIMGLQWGRVVIDAESRVGDLPPVGERLLLQWGRVVIDAERSR